MPPTHKVAIIQLYPEPLSPAQNFAKAASYIRSAAAQGAALAVLPEYHLTNWVPEDPHFPRLCADTWEEYLQKYQALARETGICIVPGTIVGTREGTVGIPASPSPGVTPALRPGTDTPAPTGGAADYSSDPPLQNTAYFIDARGDILGSYTKKNLWGPNERAHLRSSGREPHPVIQTPLGPVGLLICWDLAFPEAFRELIAQGAKMILLPVFWRSSDASDEGLKYNPSAEALFVDSMLTARAFEGTCAVICANAGGPVGKGYMGLSQVCMPFMGSILRLGGAGEGMGCVDVDMKVLEEAEANYCVRADLAREDWHYDYRHDVKVRSTES